MEKLPTQKENPTGLHNRFLLHKIDEYGNATPVDKDAEYFILRLDDRGRDKNHVRACREAVHTYADKIEPFIPQLAKDLRERYPLLIEKIG